MKQFHMRTSKTLMLACLCKMILYLLSIWLNGQEVENSLLWGFYYIFISIDANQHKVMSRTVR